jgi:hypothetical protein
MEALTTIPPVSASLQSNPASKPAQTLKVTGKNKAAIDLMVWEGLKRADAAKAAGLVEHSLYVALTKPHVKAYYLRQLDVLRTSERARNIHTLAEVRDQTTNQMARVQAVKALEQLDDVEQASGRVNSLPGLQIVIVQGGSAAPAIDVTPGAIDARLTQP